MPDLSDSTQLNQKEEKKNKESTHKSWLPIESQRVGENKLEELFEIFTIRNNSVAPV